MWLKFHDALLEADLAAAEEVRRRGHSCGGRLHRGHYPRKPRGLDEEAEAAGRYTVRFSFCCSRDGCRKRVTPPSVRFLGRHVFAAVFVILGSGSVATPVSASPPTPPPSRQTAGRWRSLWHEGFAKSAAYVELVAARMSAPLCLDEMPQALLDRLAGGPLLQVERLLRLLAPWTTVTVPPAEASFVMVR
ncbi:MAG: hypothetical protein IPN77_31725 [Sandaracinaceae bacterium]|nr:hypothetical protein [Sandaracinaceae bacterium]